MDDVIQLKAEGLCKSFAARGGRKSAPVRAVHDVSFSIRRGETLGLVGESGCGKTTLGRVILRLIQPDSGRIWFAGQDITHADMRPYRRRMQIVFQDPLGSLDPRTRVMETVAEGLRANGIGKTRREREDTVLSMLEKVGLPAGAAANYPHEFSGGQQQRIGIARALVVSPEFVVCDEPVSSLDVSCQSQIINLLEDLQADMGLTYLFISHDLSVVRHISDRIGVVYLGRLVELGGDTELALRPAHPYTKKLLSAIPVPDPELARARRGEQGAEEAAIRLDAPAAGCRFAPRCPLAVERCREAEPELREIAPGHMCACHII